MNIKNSNNDNSQDIRNFVAKHMYDNGCKTQIVEDKKSKMKRGEGKYSFNSSISRKQF